MELSQEQYDEIIKKLRRLSFQQQEANDLFEGGLTSRNISSFLNTYIINEKDSLDDTYDMYVHFNIISEMIKIVSVKVSFWILNYRAYSKTVPSGGGHTTVSGGGSTTVSGGGSTTVSGGGSTTVSGGGATSSAPIQSAINSFTTVDAISHDGGYLVSGSVIGVTPYDHNHTVYNHQHDTPNHQHATPNHAHATPNHDHAIKDHVHDLTFGVYEEENSPTIKFYISDTGEDLYSDTFFGGFTADKANIDITDYITSVGSKMIKFTSTTRTRLSVQIEIKLEVNY